jgi:cation diffusion facilitator CzcD-associated flavoprotein CzcO
MTRDVAVIGAGPGGLIAARWLLSQGFEPTIFEQGPMLGGQWTALDGRSGVWPSMHTNSSRTMTAFSDLEHETERVYPSNRDILDYLRRYAATFGLTSRIRLGNRVDIVRQDGTGWLVSHAGTQERFARVVVASGRFHAPPSQLFQDSTRSPVRREQFRHTTTKDPLSIEVSALWWRAERSAPSKSRQNSHSSARHAWW